MSDEASTMLKRRGSATRFQASPRPPRPPPRARAARSSLGRQQPLYTEPDDGAGKRFLMQPPHGAPMLSARNETLSENGGSR